MNLKYKYSPNGVSYGGIKIPDIPTVRLILRQEEEIRAIGTAIIDTGFDGGIYPSLPLLRFSEDFNLIRMEKLGSAFEEKWSAKYIKSMHR